MTLNMASDSAYEGDGFFTVSVKDNFAQLSVNGRCNCRTTLSQ